MTDAKSTPERVILTPSEAISRLPDTPRLHTFRGQRPPIGADWTREKVVEAIRAAKAVKESPRAMLAMRHGVAFEDEKGWVFVETKEKP
jgi:hypothetical protein